LIFKSFKLGAFLPGIGPGEWSQHRFPENAAVPPTGFGGALVQPMEAGRCDGIVPLQGGKTTLPWTVPDRAPDLPIEPEGRFLFLLKHRI
ncbi:hypothetical protein ABTM45_19220, partial [Acinetobacter baumannii]